MFAGEQEVKMSEVQEKHRTVEGDLEKRKIQVQNAAVQTDLAGAKYIAAMKLHQKHEESLENFLGCK